MADSGENKINPVLEPDEWGMERGSPEHSPLMRGIHQAISAYAHVGTKRQALRAIIGLCNDMLENDDPAKLRVRDVHLLRRRAAASSHMADDTARLELLARTVEEYLPPDAVHPLPAIAEP